MKQQTTQQRPRRRARVFPWILIVMGVMASIGAFTPDKRETDPTKKREPIPVLVFGLLMAGGGLYWLMQSRKAELVSSTKENDKEVLRLAARSGGRVTVAQVVLDSNLSMEEAEESLERLCRQNIAQPDLAEDGAVVYSFNLLKSEGG